MRVSCTTDKAAERGFSSALQTPLDTQFNGRGGGEGGREQT